MIKILLTGVWAALVTLGSSYGVMIYMVPAGDNQDVGEIYGGLETLKTRDISVPVILDGVIEGYVIAQFSFTIAAAELERLSVKPEDFILNEAFRMIYAKARIKQGKYQKIDIAALTGGIISNVNKRFGKPLLRDVLISSIKFVKKGKTRGQGKKSGGQKSKPESAKNQH